MESVVLIGVAGGLGAVCRHGVGIWTKGLLSSGNVFPLGTLLVNVVGSFCLGLVLGLAHQKRFAPEVATPVGTGFLGAFTTFSTFSCDTVKLIEDDRHGMAFGSVTANVLLGLLAAALGFACAQALAKSAT